MSKPTVSSLPGVCLTFGRYLRASPNLLLHVRDNATRHQHLRKMRIQRIPNPPKVEGEMFVLGCTSGYQTVAMCLKIGKQIPTLDW